MKETQFLVLIERDGELGWLGCFDILPLADSALEDWIASPDTQSGDVAFIVPAIRSVRKN
jgi:hypothetical protein